MSSIPSSTVIGKNEDGSDITQDVDVLVGRARFPRIAVMTRQFLSIPAASATAERVFSFAGLTISDLSKRLIVVVCCAGSYLLRRPCRQLQVANHHRYRKLTNQGWKCNACD